MFSNPYICPRSRILSPNQDIPFLKCMRSQCSVSDNDNRSTCTIPHRVPDLGDKFMIKESENGQCFP